MRRLLGFLLIWGLGLWPPLVGNLVVTVAGIGLFFAAVPVIARWSGIGGYRELGLTPHRGWQRGLLVGFGLGSLYPLLLFTGLALTGGVEPVGWAPWPGVLVRGLLILAETCYIGFWEELLCRGYLLRGLPQRLPRPVTLLLVGLVFSAFHVPRLGAPAAWWVFWFISGIMFALPVLATGSLWFSAGLHWGLDLMWFALLTGNGLLRFGSAGAGVLNSGTIALVSVLLFLPVVWWAASRGRGLHWDRWTR